ncbi:MAG TPA: hypothetical protein VFR87_21225 [Nocardioidaceae bacterium]|nr:hypothetical protein [Nocardioidaceae bacterium]
MSDQNTRVVRRSLRALALTPALLLPLVAAPALAAPPQTWPDPEPVSALDYLMVLLIIPLGLVLLITLLAYVPAMVKGEKYKPGRSWRNENEWFGGPKDGLEAADKAEVPATETERGGASARW